MDFFAARGTPVRVPTTVNEGEGDFLLAGDVILGGSGFRSAPGAHAEVAATFNREVVPLQLVDPRYYHADTAIAVLDPGARGTDANIAYLPSAFTPASRAELRRRFPDAIAVCEADASVLGLNSFSDGRHVVIAARATDFARQLAERGYIPVGVDLSELLRGGGGVKCCTLSTDSL